MAAQTSTTTIDTSQGHSNITPLVGVLDNAVPQQASAENDGGDVDIDPSPSNPLPKPNIQLSDKAKEEQEFTVTYYADEDEKIFDEAFHNEDHLLKKYWETLKLILETPCEDRDDAYKNLKRRIGQVKPAPRYKKMRDVLMKWAEDGYKDEPKIVFLDPNGEEYHEPRTEQDGFSKQRGHEKDKLQPTDEVTLPTDMAYFNDLYENEVTPLIGTIFDKPRLAQEGPGRALDAINNKIKSRVAEEQVRMSVGDEPSLINVDLQVPITSLLQLMIRGTHELLSCNKKSVGEIEDQNTLSAYKLLETQLTRAKQPMLWHESLGKLVEVKAERWREHLAAKSDATADENLWDPNFEAFVNTQAPDPEYIKKFYDGRNAPGGPANGQTDAPGNTQGEGQNPENNTSKDVDMSEANREEGSGDDLNGSAGTSGPAMSLSATPLEPAAQQTSAPDAMFGIPATESAQADVFADAENKTGQIGGFRVAGRTRDGTPTSHQVLVNVGTYGRGIILWHIKNADQYRESLVEEYKANKGTEVLPSTGSVGDMRRYPLTGVGITGVAYIERSSSKDLKMMPMMFIQAKTGDDAEPTFWSRSFMSKVWGERAATLKIRRLMQEAKMPMPIVPEGASKRTCTLWGVDFAGTSDTFDKGDVVIPGDGGSLAPGSQDSIRLDKARRIEELKAQLAKLEGTT